jgi:hypothetical protein
MEWIVQAPAAISSVTGPLTVSYTPSTSNLDVPGVGIVPVKIYRGERQISNPSLDEFPTSILQNFSLTVSGETKLGLRIYFENFSGFFEGSPESSESGQIRGFQAPADTPTWSGSSPPIASYVATSASGPELDSSGDRVNGIAFWSAEPSFESFPGVPQEDPLPFGNAPYWWIDI